MKKRVEEKFIFIIGLLWLSIGSIIAGVGMGHMPWTQWFACIVVVWFVSAMFIVGGIEGHI